VEHNRTNNDREALLAACKAVLHEADSDTDSSHANLPYDVVDLVRAAVQAAEAIP
jgi:hypothetical protein